MVQIIETKLLSDDENLLLKNLRSDLTVIDMKVLLDSYKKYEQHRDLYIGYLARVSEANPEVYEEAINMLNPRAQEVFDRIATKTGLKEQYIEEGKRKTALEMLEDRMPIEKVAKYVKMPISWVEDLTNQ